MKILLIGPYPPPHGGVSVHLAGIARQLAAAGIPHEVLDTSRVRNWGAFVVSLIRFTLSGWMLHFHSNGHNWKDWTIACVCGAIGQLRAGSILTLHSGLAPEYLARVSRPMRSAIRLTCALQLRVIAVSEPIRKSLQSIGVAGDSIDVAEACLGIGDSQSGVLDANLAGWIRDHRPLLSAALFFRPEYGFDTLVAALGRLVRRYPELGCVVMGSGEDRMSAGQRVREAGLEGNIYFAGDVEHETCLTLMSLSDVFVRSTLRDGDSISVREALALGTPVVASRTAFRPRGATLFDPGDAAGMAAAVELAVQADRCEAEVQSGSINRLMAIYRQSVTPEGL